MMMDVVPHFINGQVRNVPSQKSYQVTNPALGEVTSVVYYAEPSLTEDVVMAASNAWPAWSATPPVTRARILFKFRELLEQHQAELAALITQEHGKTLDDAKGSVARAIEVVEYHCGLVQQFQSPLSMDVSNDIDCFTIRQSLGVCVGVSPFNFPVMVPVWMIIPAIACGNTFILKPSEQDPSATLRLFELLSEAGLPPGVANCLHGDKATVDYLTTHSLVKACTAVASTPVAESIYQTAIAHGKRAHTFGGAKNHCVVMPDADLDQTAQAIVGAAYGSAGERCMAISVVVTVGERTGDLLLDKLKPLTESIRIEPGNVPGSDMGPLVSAAHRERVLAAIIQGVGEGAELLIDGRAFSHPQYPQGFFIGPTLFDRVHETMSVYQNEIFGPVLCVVRVNDLSAAIALINRHQYGNGTAIFTRDGYSARYFTQQVSVGMVGVNIPIPVPVANHPFGGWKRSSFGDTNMHGGESLHFYTRRKTITSKWLTHKAGDMKDAFAMPTHD